MSNGTPAATLPANFFANKKGPEPKTAPQTLPANFDFKTGAAPPAAPPPKADAQAAAAQATGLRPQGKGDDVLSAFMASPQQKAMEKANVDAAEFGASALGAQKILGMMGGAFKPTVTKVPVPSGLFDADGAPIMHEVEKLGKSAVGKGAQAVSDWIKNNPKKSFLIFEFAKELALSPEKAMKMVHVIGK
jgi:hypothetical protein